MNPTQTPEPKKCKNGCPGGKSYLCYTNEEFLRCSCDCHKPTPVKDEQEVTEARKLLELFLNSESELPNELRHKTIQELLSAQKLITEHEVRKECAEIVAKGLDEMTKGLSEGLLVEQQIASKKVMEIIKNEFKRQILGNTPL